MPDGSLSKTSEIDAAVQEKILASSDSFLVERVSATGTPTLSVPVKFRDQVVGIIHIEAANNKRKWTEDEVIMVQAVSERAALALENANLFVAAERGVTQERLISEITTRIGESKDIDQILQTTVQELGRMLGTTRTYIQLGTATMSDQE